MIFPSVYGFLTKYLEDIQEYLQRRNQINSLKVKQMYNRVQGRDTQELTPDEID